MVIQLFIDGFRIEVRCSRIPYESPLMSLVLIGEKLPVGIFSAADEHGLHTVYQENAHGMGYRRPDFVQLLLLSRLGVLVFKLYAGCDAKCHSQF